MQPTKQHWPALCEPAMCAAAVCHGLCRGFVRNLPQNAFVPRAGPRPPATAAKSRASGFDCTGLGSVTDSLSIEWDCTALVAVWAAAAPAPPRPACAVLNDLAPPPHAAPLQYSRAPLRVHRCESCTFCANLNQSKRSRYFRAQQNNPGRWQPGAARGTAKHTVRT